MFNLLFHRDMEFKIFDCKHLVRRIGDLTGV
jgi:hypothetical protein